MTAFACPGCGSVDCPHLARILGGLTLTDECVFCDTDKITSTVHKASALGVPLLVFEPQFPVVPGHVLVAPVRHVPDAAADPFVAGACQVRASELARDYYPAANIITSIGEPATQSIRHLHLHVVPRVDGDGLALPWSSGQTRVMAGRRREVG